MFLALALNCRRERILNRDEIALSSSNERRKSRAASVTPLSHSVGVGGVGGDKMREKVTRIISIVNGRTAKKSIALLSAGRGSGAARRRRRFAKAMPFFHGMDGMDAARGLDSLHRRVR